MQSQNLAIVIWQPCAKGGKLLAYHEIDPDHMREAVAYKRLTALQNQG